MIKVKSVSDVITNSSSEVFILNTKKPLKRVKKVLKGITSGYMEPEVIEKGSDVWETLDGFGYFIDDTKENYLEEYYLCLLQDYWLFNSDKYRGGAFKPDYDNPYREKYFKKWIEYLNEHRESLKKTWKGEGNNPFSEEFTMWGVYIEDLPKGFITEFLEKNNIKLRKPSHGRRMSSLIGRIGFVSEDENSIPYDTFRKIYRKLGGESYHLG